MIAFDVIGEPQPQGNKTGFVNKRTGKVVMTEGRRPEARESFKSWRGGVTAAARVWQDEHQVELLDEPVCVELVFRMSKPSSQPKWRWLPWSRPDIDKLARAVLDGITGVIIKDDGRVVELVCRKVYAFGRPPGAHIVITPIGAYERAAATEGTDVAASAFADGEDLVVDDTAGTLAFGAVV